MDTVGGRIQAARIAKGLTQEQFGKLVGVSKGAVSQWEAGDIKGLKAENIMALSIAADVSALWVLKGRNEDGTPIPMGRPTHLDPDSSDLVETFRALPEQSRDELIAHAHKLLRNAALQHPSRTNPFPQAKHKKVK